MLIRKAKLLIALIVAFFTGQDELEKSNLRIAYHSSVFADASENLQKEAQKLSQHQELLNDEIQAYKNAIARNSQRINDEKEKITKLYSTIDKLEKLY